MTENEKLKEMLADAVSSIDLAKAGCLSTKILRPLLPGECDCVACEIGILLSLPAPDLEPDRIGCYDNSCVFRILRPGGGVGTNGGCLCFDDLVSWNEKAQRWNREEVRLVRRNTMMLVKRLRELEEVVKILKDRQPSKQEGDAFETKRDSDAGSKQPTGECFVDRGGWTGNRCRVCTKWVWGGPTACEACVAREERDEARSELLYVQGLLNSTKST